jgi:hypothetical protein
MAAALTAPIAAISIGPETPLRFWLLEHGHVSVQLHRYIGHQKLEEVSDLAFSFTAPEEASAVGAVAAWEQAIEASPSSLCAASRTLQTTIEKGILRGPRVQPPRLISLVRSVP